MPGITAASSSPDQAWTLAVDADPLVVPTDLAVPLGLIVNELVTNAIQHSRPTSRGGRVQIVLRTAPEGFSITVLDEGNGPALQSDAPTHGLGARMIEAFSRKIDATITKGRPAGYGVTVTVPRADATVNQM